MAEEPKIPAVPDPMDTPDPTPEQKSKLEQAWEALHGVRTPDPEPTKPPPTPDNPQQLAAPICPRCNADPMRPIAREYNMAHYKLLMIFCSSCRVNLSVAVMAVAQPVIDTNVYGRGGSRIVL